MAPAAAVCVQEPSAFAEGWAANGIRPKDRHLTACDTVELEQTAARDFGLNPLMDTLKPQINGPLYSNTPLLRPNG